MTNDTINCIRTVARVKSFSQAAKKLSVSQPAISSQIRNAEKELNIRIFDRKAHPLRLTSEGVVLLDYLDRREELDRNFQEKLRGLSSLEHGRLRIGGTSAFNIAYIPKAVGEFSRRYPGIDIQITDGTIGQLRQKVLDGDLDLFVSSPTDQTGGLHFEELAETKIYFCVPPQVQLDDRLKEKEVPPEALDGPGDVPEVSLREFEGIPLIRLAPERNLGHLLDELILRDHVTRPVHILVDQAVTSYMMTVKGVGACLMSGVDIRNLRLRESPHFFMLSNEICRRMMYVASREGSMLSPAAQIFSDLLRSGFRDPSENDQSIQE